MASYKEIVTKAVVGKAKKNSVSKFVVKPEETPDTILGCWVINHNFEGKNQNGVVNINGAFDVNVWYSYNNDTKTAVSTKRFQYNDKMNVRLKDGAALSDATEIIVRSLNQPTVTDVYINNGVVNLSVEKELGVEIVGNTMIKVSVEEDPDDYEVLEDFDEASVAEDINAVNEDYLS
ncbi:MAG: outer spore coat protein CotE [Bacilli bacterium]|nr:outer spore coat protein CotE [Bacilli bacterium]MCX4254154.1 outer spore coat protein CotE [Bacilli bacterium]